MKRCFGIPLKKVYESFKKEVTAVIAVTFFIS